MIYEDQALEIWGYMMENAIDSPEQLEGRQVRVHWHFSAKRYSVAVRARNGRWYVVRHRATGEQAFFGKLVLSNARFRVQPAGAKKAYETGKRNVHAHVIGTVTRATYNPEEVYVPCGMDVMYSSILYPEPEFKLRATSDIRIYMGDYPGIRSAEMLVLGTQSITNNGVLHPKMLAAGKVETV